VEVHVLVLLLLIDWIFSLYAFAIILRTLLSWLRVSPYHPVMHFLTQITEPILAPLRRHIRPIGIWDITPMIALIILWVVELIIKQILQTLAMLP
jgi:YggT family protein